MLDDGIRTQLSAYLERVTQPVELIASLDGSDAARDMRELLTQIAALAPDRITARFDGSFDRRPSFQVTRAGHDMGVHFAALPMGHEFTSLVLALLWAGGHPPKVDAAVLEQVRALPGTHRFETFMSLSCHNCPDVVQALHLMAVINPGVTAVAIDGALFQAEVESREILAVPSVLRNGEAFGSGRMELAEILARLDSGTAQRAAEQLSTREPYDVLIVGGGPAGAAAAVYAARKGIRTALVAERFGGQTLDTLGIENYPSVLETEGPAFAASLEAQVRRYGVDLVTSQRVARVEPADQPGDAAEVQLESGGVVRGRTVVLAPGARWRSMGVPGEQEYRTRGVAYCPHCDGPLFKGKDVAVIGGGNSGVEAAIDLAGVVRSVTLLEFADRLRADQVLVDKLRSLPNVRVHLNAQTTEVTGDGRRMDGLLWTDRVTGESHRLDVAGVFVQIGLVPNTEFLKGTVELNRFGEIVVDAKGHTSAPGLFAAGDATTVPYKQIVVATGEGAKAALSAFDHLIRLPQAA